MVSLDAVHASNALISTSLPAGLVSVFVGGTSGLGELTLKELARQSVRPRIYIVGRSLDAAERIIDQCKTVNAAAQITFQRVTNIGLMTEVDKVCNEIKQREKVVDLLFLSAGSPAIDRDLTSEGLHRLLAEVYYSRVRAIQQLLPLLQASKVLGRVVTINGGSSEGKLQRGDLDALRLSLLTLKPHLCTLSTLGLEALAQTCGSMVSIVTTDPGVVHTPIQEKVKGWIGVAIRTILFFNGWWLCVPLLESGERHLFLATSGRFAPGGVQLVDGVEKAKSTTGVVGGSGLYSVGWDGNTISPKIKDLLADYRKTGVVDEVWKHTQSQLERAVKV